MFSLAKPASQVSDSVIYSWRVPLHRKFILGFIHYILDAAAKSSPTTSATKDFEKRAKELLAHKQEVEDLVFESDGDFVEMEDSDEESLGLVQME